MKMNFYSKTKLIFIFFIYSCATNYIKKDLGPKNTTKTSAAFIFDSVISYSLISSGKTTAIYLGYTGGFYAVVLYGYFIFFREDTRWVSKPMLYKSPDGRSILFRTDGIAEIKNPKELNDINVQILCRFGDKSNCKWEYGISEKGNLLLNVSAFEPEGWMGRRIFFGRK